MVCLSLIPPTSISPVPSKSILLRFISLKQGLPTAYQIKSELFGLAFWHFHKWILVYHSSPMSQAPILDPRWAYARPWGSVCGHSSFCWDYPSPSPSPPIRISPVPCSLCDASSSPHSESLSSFGRRLCLLLFPSTYHPLAWVTDTLHESYHHGQQ